MRLSVVLPTRLSRTPDGNVWNQGPPDCAFFDRYLQVFDEVNVISRVKDVDKLDGEWRRVNGNGVKVTSIPYYVGPYQYLGKRKMVKTALAAAITKDDAVIVRSPDVLCVTVAQQMNRQRRPFGVEVIGDPYDNFAPGSVSNLFRPFFRYHFTRKLQQLCKQASAVSYVTSNALQKRYPASADAFSTHYSSIQLYDNAYSGVPNRIYSDGKSLKLIFVGGFSQLHKGQQFLLDAFQVCLKSGCDLTLTMVGGGKYENDFKAQAESNGVADRVRFLGHLPGPDSVRVELDHADIFVLPSLAEGLPRALIEAMARGLPAISTTVGGIPELLPKDEMVSPGDATALAEKIQEVVRDPARMAQMSQRNQKVSMDYRNEILTAKRNKLYNHLLQLTSAWQTS